MIDVEYEVLTPVVDTGSASGNAATVHDDVPGNLCYRWSIGDRADVESVIKSAAHVTTLSYANQRLIPNAMEPRGANASYDFNADSYTLYVSNQNPHVERLLMCAFVLGIPEHKMRVVAPDVGGGFGSKIFGVLYCPASSVACRMVGTQVEKVERYAPIAAVVSAQSARKLPSLSRASLAVVTWSRPCASDRNASPRSQVHLMGRLMCLLAHTSAVSSP